VLLPTFFFDFAADRETRRIPLTPRLCRKSRDPTLGHREAAEFLLAYVVAFRHPIFQPISGGDGIHDTNFNAPASFTADERTRFSLSSDGDNDEPHYV
jgi:hypothetical protein